jgi:hypothetical protein
MPVTHRLFVRQIRLTQDESLHTLKYGELDPNKTICLYIQLDPLCNCHKSAYSCYSKAQANHLGFVVIYRA